MRVRLRPSLLLFVAAALVAASGAQQQRTAASDAAVFDGRPTTAVVEAVSAVEQYCRPVDWFHCDPYSIEQTDITASYDDLSGVTRQATVSVDGDWRDQAPVGATVPAHVDDDSSRLVLDEAPRSSSHLWWVYFVVAALLAGAAVVLVR